MNDSTYTAMYNPDDSITVVVETPPATDSTAAPASQDTTSSNSLESYLDKNISEICTNNYIAADKSHCAHFVSHVKGYDFSGSATCANATWATKNNPGASFRVDEVFAKCPIVGKWEDKPDTLAECLAFVTRSSNVDLSNHTMGSHLSKHIGIYSNGMIYHYSNTQDKVVKQTPEEFANHYSYSNTKVYYGTFPAV